MLSGGEARVDRTVLGSNVRLPGKLAVTSQQFIGRQRKKGAAVGSF
jgi:hypothetical protein